MTPPTDWRDSTREKIMEITQEYFGTRGTLPSDKIIELFEPTIEAERVKAVAEALSAKVNRLEIIDHTAKGPGRAYVKWEEGDFTVTPDLQDQGRTLKIFLDDFKEGDAK